MSSLFIASFPNTGRRSQGPSTSWRRPGNRRSTVSSPASAWRRASAAMFGPVKMLSPGAEGPDRLPTLLNERAAFFDQQQLASRMAVPIRPRRRLELPARDRDPSGFGGGRRAGDERGLRRRLLAAWLLGMTDPKDDHHQRQDEPQEHADELPEPWCREEDFSGQHKYQFTFLRVCLTIPTEPATFRTAPPRRPSPSSARSCNRTRAGPPLSHRPGQVAR